MSAENSEAVNHQILTHRFLASGQWDRALGAAREWLGQDPESGQAHRAAGQSLLNLNRPAEAQKHLEKVLAGNPQDGFGHRMMSMVQFDQGRFAEADESIRRALAINPQDAFHWYHLARMCYQHGDLVTARKSIGKAVELDPRDADILNLKILCNPAGSAAEKIQEYEKALELDPENSSLHNNIGLQYLYHLKDYAKAEDCFRRALFFEPSSKISRVHLLQALKQRDKVYRVLCAPKDFLLKIVVFFSDLRKKSVWLFVLMIPIWLLAIRFILGGLILWLFLIWPLTRVYEYLMIGDIRARSGELGARKGGLLGYRKWPVRVRLGIFAVCLVSFWGWVAYLCWSSSNAPEGTHSIIFDIAGLVFTLGLFAILILYVRHKVRGVAKRRAARRRARELESILEPGAKKRRWWQIFGNKTKTS